MENNKEEEEYPGEFKYTIIKIIVLLPSLAFGGLYFFYDNNLYLYLFLGLGILDLVIFEFFLKKKRKNKSN